MKDINQSITTGSQVNGAKDIDTKQSNVIPLPTDQKKTESFLMSLTPEDMAVLMLNFDDDFIRATISAMTLEGLLGPIVDGVERVANKINKSSAPKAPTASKITAAAQADQEDYDYEDPVTAHMKADECPPLPMGNKSKDDDAIKVAIGNKANSYQICRATPSSCKFYSSCMECPVQEDLNIGCCQCKSAENGSCTTYRLMK